MGILLEPNKPCERDKFIDVFFEKVHHTIFRENGMWKHQGMPHVCTMLEAVSEEIGVPIEIVYDEGIDIAQMVIKDDDIKFLPFILKEFKKEYRQRG